MKLFFLFNCLDKNKGQTSRHPIPLSSLHLRSGRKCEEESPTRLPSTSFPGKHRGFCRKWTSALRVQFYWIGLMGNATLLMFVFPRNEQEKNSRPQLRQREEDGCDPPPPLPLSREVMLHTSPHHTHDHGDDIHLSWILFGRKQTLEFSFIY